MTKILI